MLKKLWPVVIFAAVLCVTMSLGLIVSYNTPHVASDAVLPEDAQQKLYVVSPLI